MARIHILQTGQGHKFLLRPSLPTELEDKTMEISEMLERAPWAEGHHIIFSFIAFERGRAAQGNWGSVTEGQWTGDLKLSGPQLHVLLIMENPR